MRKPTENNDNLKASKLNRRPDSATDSGNGHASHMPGSGADLASTDMEVPEPSRDTAPPSASQR